MGTSLASLMVVTLALFTDSLIYGLTIPLTPRSPAGITEDWMFGVLYIGYSVGVILATLACGVLSDRIGRRAPMIWGAIVQLLALWIFGTAKNFPLMLFSRILMGAAAAAAWTPGLALVAEKFSKNRALMLGYAMSGSTFGLVLGPMVGGFLLEWRGYEFPVLAVGALALLDMAFRLTVIRDLPASRRQGSELGALLRDRSVLAASLTIVLGAWCWCVLEALLPNHLEKVSHAPASVVGLIFTSGCITYGLICPIAGASADRYGAWRTIQVGFLVMVFTLPLVSFTNRLVQAGILLSIVNTSYGLMMNPALSKLAEVVESRGTGAYASVYAVYNIAYSVGMSASGLAAGLLVSRFSFSTTLLITSFILLLCFPFVISTASRGEQRSQILGES